MRHSETGKGGGPPTALASPLAARRRAGGWVSEMTALAESHAWSDQIVRQSRIATALTVILPCFNEAERLPATLQSLLAHLPRDPGQVEVLVVDDGSTDATVQVAKAAAAIDARVRV